MNREIEEFRKALVFDAKICDWEMFEGKAGMLFDYLESIELAEIRKLFSRIIRMVLSVLLLAGSVAWGLILGTNGSLLRYQNSILVVMLAGVCFLLFFFADFRLATGFLASRHQTRRRNFIRNIEQDFRSRLEAVCAKTREQGAV